LDNWNGIISLLIGCIEFVLIINLFIFAEKNRFNNIAIGIIALLMVYQSLEFIICRLGYSSSFLAYLAFFDISFLPLLDLLLIYTFFIREEKKIKLLFIIPLIFLFYYVLVIKQFVVVSCTVLYVIYNYPLGTLYGVYFYLPVAVSVYSLIYYLQKRIAGKKTFFAGLFLTGHAIMIIPVLFAFLLSALNMPGMLAAVESIMCKFGFFYALCLSFFALNYKVIINE
jgi:hypothetical protein